MMSDSRTRETFIGRSREQELFAQWLSDPAAPKLLYFHDALEDVSKKGGIGKTKLLHKCRVIARQHQHITSLIDFFHVADRDGVVIAERLVQNIHRKYRDWTAISFKTMLRRYYTAMRKGINEQGIRERLGQALLEDLQTLEERLRENNTFIILFFDTFELIEKNTAVTVLQAGHFFPENYGFTRIRAVIAGRNALNWSRPNWVGREEEVLVCPLSPFTYEEALHYLRATSSAFRLARASTEALHTLYQLTEGRPILIGLVADVINHELKEVDELISIPSATFEASLVDQINYFADPLQWAILFMAHIYHRFNAELLSIIMREPELQAIVPPLTYQELPSRLLKLSFVRRPNLGTDFVLHDEMRRLVTIHCWEKQDPDKRIRRELSKLALVYYENCLLRAPYEQARQSYSVEMLFHLLFIDIDKGFAVFQTQFEEAIRLSLRAFASSLLREVSKFIEGMSSEQYTRVQLSIAKLLQEEENPAAALQVYQEIEKDSGLSPLIRAEILSEKGACYEHLSQFTDAITCLKEALTIEEWRKNLSHYATTLSYLAYNYHLKGDFAEAANYYKANIELLQTSDYSELYGHNLGNFGDLHWRQGNLEEALYLAQRALQSRQDLFKQGKGNALFLSWSFSLLGRIYIDLKDLAEAEKCFRQNLDLGNQIGDKREIARAYIGFGLIRSEQGDLKTALQYFDQAYRVTIHIEEKIESLRGQGSVFLLQKQWEEAVDSFERAAQLAQTFGKTYHQALCLIELSFPLAKLAKSTTHILEHAKRIAQKYHYSDLEARIQKACQSES